jgi:uncharacterized protein YgiM (DUF1202 family)
MMKSMKRVRLLGVFAMLLAVIVTASVAGTARADTATLPLQVSVGTTTNVYDAPTADGNVVGQLVAGQVWFVLGTDTTGKWTEIQIVSGISSGWVPSSTLNLSGITLPVLDGVTGGPLTPTPAPAPTEPVALTVPFMATVKSSTPLYDAPSTSSDVVGSLAAGQTWFILGTDSTGTWIQVQIVPNLSGWAPASTIAVKASSLPKIDGFTAS